jgi:hypothetical protein
LIKKSAYARRKVEVEAPRSPSLASPSVFQKADITPAAQISRIPHLKNPFDQKGLFRCKI